MNKGAPGMDRVEISDRLPRCSRCGGDLMTSVVMPQDDAEGWPIHLELCTACDAAKAAAGALWWFDEGGGRDLTRVDEGARLLFAWMKEGMAEHGWFFRERPVEDP